jgi:hypothetical protein
MTFPLPAFEHGGKYCLGIDPLCSVQTTAVVEFSNTSFTLWPLKKQREIARFSMLRAVAEPRNPES